MQNPPEQLADFEVIETIGEGSFSKVKLVRRHLDGKLLALKQVNMDKLGPSERNSALNEIRLLASIRSPYVICYEGSFYDTSSNTLCLLMEYADNGDLEVPYPSLRQSSITGPRKAECRRDCHRLSSGGPSFTCSKD